MIDRFSKFLLATIALGLWVNIGLAMFRATPASAQNDDIYAIRRSVQSIALGVSGMSTGVCTNSKICGP